LIYAFECNRMGAEALLEMALMIAGSGKGQRHSIYWQPRLRLTQAIVCLEGEELQELPGSPHMASHLVLLCIVGSGVYH